MYIPARMYEFTYMQNALPPVPIGRNQSVNSAVHIGSKIRAVFIVREINQSTSQSKFTTKTITQ